MGFPSGVFTRAFTLPSPSMDQTTVAASCCSVIEPSSWMFSAVMLSAFLLHAGRTAAAARTTRARQRSMVKRIDFLLESDLAAAYRPDESVIPEVHDGDYLGYTPKRAHPSLLKMCPHPVSEHDSDEEGRCHNLAQARAA